MKKNDTTGTENDRRKTHLLIWIAIGVIIIFVWILWHRKALIENNTYQQQNSASRQVAGALKVADSSITFPQINPSVWQYLSDYNLVLTGNNYYTFVSDNFVELTESLATGDISGSFTGGFTINSDSVNLGEDTVGDYVKNIQVGNGLSANASGEASSAILNITTGNGLVTSSGGVSALLNINGGLAFVSGGISLLDSCSSNQLLKWNSGSSSWGCANDADTTYTAGSGLSLTSTSFAIDSLISIFKTIDASLGTDPVADGLTDTLTFSSGDGVNVTGNSTTDTLSFSLNLASGGGLLSTGGALSILNSCSNGQFLTWTSGSSSWGCTSATAAPNIFQTIAGDSGSAVTDSSIDTLTLVGGNGLASIGSDVSDTVTFNIDLASGSGLAISSGALTIQSCSDGEILKRVSGAWTCASDSVIPGGAYQEHLSGADNVNIGSSLTPLLTNGSGTAQGLSISITSGSGVSFAATVEVSSSLATGPVSYTVIRDDNGDNDCVTGGGDGTQIGGQASTFLSTIAQSFTTTISFVDLAPGTTTPKYQLCASTTIATGTTAATDRSLSLLQVDY